MMLLNLASIASSEDAVSGKTEPIATALQFAEGPVWLPGKGLLFSDIPADTIYRADKSIFRKPSGKSNGLTLDRSGRLIVCEHWNRRVTRTEDDGTVTVLADQYLGRKLNSPNDVVVRSDGMIFFTDPPYGLEGREPELPFAGVYGLPPDGKLTLLSVYFKFPNGLAFSPDEKTLYVGDSGLGFIEAFDVAADGGLGNARLFAKDEDPDGMKVDERGRLWVGVTAGIRVYEPAGTVAHTVPIPEKPTNCAFGDDDHKTLYVTAIHGVYKVRCAVRGIVAGKNP